MVPALYVALSLLLVIQQPSVSLGADPLDPTKTWHIPHDIISVNFSSALVTGRDYLAYLAHVQQLVTAHSRNAAYNVPVLSPQTPDMKPYRWLMLDVAGRGQDRAMIALRQDNLYIAAFTDMNGNWYVFQNKANLNLIPGATVLGIEDGYKDLVGGYKMLGAVPLGREPTLTALHTLATYRHPPPSDDAAVKNAVAVMALTLAEASRFRPISANVASRWVPGLTIGFQANLVVNWKEVSCALMVSAQNNNRWGNPSNRKDEAHKLGGDPLWIQNLQEAIGVPRVLIWPKDSICSEKITWLVN